MEAWVVALRIAVAPNGVGIVHSLLLARGFILGLGGSA